MTRVRPIAVLLPWLGAAGMTSCEPGPRVFGPEVADLTPAVVAAEARIFFERGSGIGAPDAHVYAMNPDGSGVVALTQGPDGGNSPSVSPDGTRVAFGRFDGSEQHVWVMDVDGMNATRITPDGSFATLPDWSPDGSRIAYTNLLSGDPFGPGDREIMIIDSDGSGSPTNISNHPRSDFCPRWSPDGQRILFASDREASSPSETQIVVGYDLYVVDTDGSDLERLTDRKGLEGCGAWSPDGAQIAYGAGQGSQPGLYVMNADGSDPVRLLNVAGFIVYPDWSRDGSSLAFTSWHSGNWDVYVANRDGSGLTRLTDNKVSDARPRWGM